MSAATRESIFDLADARAILTAWFEETEGEETPELAILWAEWSAKFADKVEHTALYICERESIADAIDAQIALLTARRDAHRNEARRLKNVLQIKLEEIGTPKVEGVLKTVSLQKNPPSVKPLIDVALAPIAWVRVIPERLEWDKKKMLEAWKANPGALSGCAIVEQGVSLRIR